MANSCRELFMGAVKMMIAMLADQKRLHLQHGPIDLIVEAFGSQSEIEKAYRFASGRFETILEELVAELGSALLCTQLNQKPAPALDHSQYIKTWLRVLKHDFSYFTEALELARSAIYFLNDLTGIYPFLKPQYQRKINENRIKTWVQINT